jgi:hypothetical protein
MNKIVIGTPEETYRAAERVARDLVWVDHFQGRSTIGLPIIYPGGTCVGVEVVAREGGYRVSDGGQALREVDAVGATRSYVRVASRMADIEALQVKRGVIFVDVPVEHLDRAICDVAAVSQRVVSHIYDGLKDEEEDEIAARLHGRLERLFRQELPDSAKIIGQSQKEWDVSAVVRPGNGGNMAVFNLVSHHSQSVYKTSAAFHDLSLLRPAPSCVSVVADKDAMGNKLALLAQAGRVISVDDPDDRFLRAAA